MDAWRRAGTTSTGRENGPKNANTLPLGKGGSLKRGHPAEDPMDPSNADTLWVGPPHLRPRHGFTIGNDQRALPNMLALPAPKNEPYRLLPEPAPSKPLAIAGPDGADVYSNDYLPGRPAGPTRPHEDLLAPEKDPNEVPLSEAERNKLRTLAKEFGFGGETLVNQYQVARRTEGFRKLYCGAISASTSEKMLQAYFAEFGEVRSVSVIRDKDTGLSKGFGFVSMQASEGAKKALLRQIHIVDNRTIRVTLTFRPPKVGEEKRKNCGAWKPKQQEERALLSDEVQAIDVREGRLYIGPLAENVSPNILEDHFSKFGLVAKSNVVRGVNNDIKKTYGVIRFRETQSCKRVLQNPKHHVNEKPVEVALSKFCLEMLMRPTTLWLWEIGYSLEQQELGKHFAQYGPVFRAIHIFNPATGEKKGYGFVDFVNENTVAEACKGPGKGPYRFTVKGQQGFFGKFLPKMLKRDLMYMEDRLGNVLLQQMHQKVPDSGTWGVNSAPAASQVKTVTCKLPRTMLPVVVGEDGKIVTDIARDAKVKLPTSQDASENNPHFDGFTYTKPTSTK